MLIKKVGKDLTKWINYLENKINMSFIDFLSLIAVFLTISGDWDKLF